MCKCEPAKLAAAAATASMNRIIDIVGNFEYSPYRGSWTGLACLLVDYIVRHRFCFVAN